MGEILSETENKRNLVRFLGEYWIDNVPDQLNDNQLLVIAGGTNDPSSAILVESNRVATVQVSAAHMKKRIHESFSMQQRQFMLDLKESLSFRLTRMFSFY